MNLRWLDGAIRNRYEQLDYLAKENPDAAVRMDQCIERDTERLLKHPLLGREGRVAGTRELVVSHSPFIVVYRMKKRRIEILRILHGARRSPPAPGTPDAD